MEELEPKVKLFKERTEQLKSLLGKAPQAQVNADVGQVVERMQNLIKDLEQAAHQRTKNRRKTAQTPRANTAAEKPAQATSSVSPPPAATASASSASPDLSQRVEELVKAAMTKQAQAGAAAQGARLSDAGVHNPKNACYNWVQKGKTCTRPNCPYAHNPADKDTVDPRRDGPPTPRGESSDNKSNAPLRQISGTTCAAQNCTKECCQEGERVHKYCSRSCAIRDGAFKGKSSTSESARTAAAADEGSVSAFTAQLYDSAPDILHSMPSTFVALASTEPEATAAASWLSKMPDDLNLILVDSALNSASVSEISQGVGGDTSEIEPQQPNVNQISYRDSVM